MIEILETVGGIILALIVVGLAIEIAERGARILTGRRK